MIEVKVDNDIVVLSFFRDDLPMNVIDMKFIDHLDKSFDEALRIKPKGIILTSRQVDFVVGGNLNEILRLTDRNLIFEQVQRINALFSKIETSFVPVVCAMNGLTVGGGYELAMACHHRICLNDERIRIGLPEVTLGLLPGAGGVQRLGRMVGLKVALPLLLEGKKIKPDQALAQGLVDELASSKDEMINQAKSWIYQIKDFAKPWYSKNFKVPGGAVQSLVGQQIFPIAIAMTSEKSWGHYPAPEKILKSLYEGLQLPFDQAVNLDGQSFAELASCRETKNMIKTLFFGVNACSKGINLSFESTKEESNKKSNKIGVLGAGLMGTGIAYVTACAGLAVVLKDLSIEIAQKSYDDIKRMLAKEVERGRVSSDGAAKTLSLISVASEVSQFKECDLVIETVVEDAVIKGKVIQEVMSVLKENAIFASNTSMLSISNLSENSQHPQNFIGLHFFSPVDKMSLIEVILGKKTSPQALAVCMNYLKKLKKTPIIVNDGYGFFTSRCFMTYIEEGMACLQDGLSPTLIENAGRACGMAMGPLAAADSVGLDVVYHVVRQTKKILGDSAVPEFMEITSDLFYKKLGRFGRKTGQGFYDYPKGARPVLWSDLEKYFSKQYFSEQKESKGKKNISFEEIQARLLYRQVLEAMKCWESGILRSQVEGDVGSILGWSFPAYSGGVLSFIDYVGKNNFLRQCNDLHQKYGDRFAPVTGFFSRI